MKYLAYTGIGIALLCVLALLDYLMTTAQGYL